MRQSSSNTSVPSSRTLRMIFPTVAINASPAEYCNSKSCYSVLSGLNRAKRIPCLSNGSSATLPFPKHAIAITPPLHSHVNGQNAHELRTSPRARLRMTRLYPMPLTPNLFQHLLTSGACLVLAIETPATTVSSMSH